MTSNKIKNLIRGLIAPGRLWLSWETTIMAMLTTSGIIAIALPVSCRPHVSVISTVTYSLDIESAHLATSSFELNPKAIAQTAISETSFPDGIYLYGQSPQPEQIGQEYIIFQVRQGQVVGAVYLPRSEFNCFQGKLDATQLSVTMINADELTNNELEIDRQWKKPSASRNLADLTAVGSHLILNDVHQVNLEAYYPIAQASDNDRRMVTTCQGARDR